MSAFIQGEIFSRCCEIYNFWSIPLIWIALELIKFIGGEVEFDCYAGDDEH